MTNKHVWHCFFDKNRIFFNQCAVVGDNLRLRSIVTKGFAPPKEQPKRLANATLFVGFSKSIHLNFDLNE